MTTSSQPGTTNLAAHIADAFQPIYAQPDPCLMLES
jgi:hypothetical protein